MDPTPTDLISVMFLIDSNSAPLVAVFWVLQDGAWQRVMVHKSPGIPATLLILLVVFLFRGTLPHSHSPRAIGSVVSAINHGKGHSAFAKERRIGEGCWWAQDPESEGREPHVLHHRISLDSRVLAQVSSTAGSLGASLTLDTHIQSLGMLVHFVRYWSTLTKSDDYDYLFLLIFQSYKFAADFAYRE